MGVMTASILTCQRGSFAAALSLFACAVLVPGRAPAAAPATSPADAPAAVAWWKFDETSGTQAADSSGHGHNAALEGGLSFDSASVPGRIGRAVGLDGKGVIRAAGFRGIAGQRPRTVALWIKTSTPGGQLVSWGEPDAGKMFILGFIRNRVGVTPRGGYLYMKAGVNDDSWHHVAVVVHEASPPNLHDHVKLYRDGEPAEIDDIGLLDMFPIDTGDKQDVLIGQRFRGAIDDVRIYDRALTDEQIRQLARPR